jgi:uncharacterized membrane protein HdeD (DUF308 family)
MVLVANMRTGMLNVLVPIEDHLDKILILPGLILLVVGLLCKTALGSWISASSLFFGIVFFTFGIFLKLGIFSAKAHSAAGVGTILICASIICIAISIALFQFVYIDVLRYVPYRTYHIYRVTCVLWVHPYSWLCNLLAQSSLVLFIGGVTAKIFSIR